MAEVSPANGRLQSPRHCHYVRRRTFPTLLDRARCAALHSARQQVGEQLNRLPEVPCPMTRQWRTRGEHSALVAEVALRMEYVGRCCRRRRAAAHGAWPRGGVLI